MPIKDVKRVYDHTCAFAVSNALVGKSALQDVHGRRMKPTRRRREEGDSRGCGLRTDTLGIVVPAAVTPERMNNVQS